MTVRPSTVQGQCPGCLFQFPRACDGMVRLGTSQALNVTEKLPVCCGSRAEAPFPSASRDQTHPHIQVLHS